MAGRTRDHANVDIGDNRTMLRLAALAAFAAFAQPRGVPPSGYAGWPAHGGGPDGIRYSRLAEIHRGNVKQLELAWQYDTGDEFRGSEMQCNPIVVDGVLYATTPRLRVIALDAATGRLIWSFDPNQGQPRNRKYRNRGVTWWQGRIYVAVREHLYALDARTGRPVPGFGREGRIDMRLGLGRDRELQGVSLTTPPAVFNSLLILGSAVGEDLPTAPGDIRAFDARTGEQKWIFHTVPHPGEPGHETWPKDAWQWGGAANVWAGLTVDEKRGLVFGATGSAAFDFYGANRHGDNLYANSVIALDARTGRRVWHFQTVRHDVWDRDHPSAPVLATVRRNGRIIDVVAQITKTGYVYVFERATGKPLFPIEYRPAPPSEIDGEMLADTQPIPLKPLPFARQRLTEEMLTTRTPEAHRAVLDVFRKLRSDHTWAPPTREGTVIFPGYDGGGGWGGQAFDPATGLLYVNSNEMAWILRLVERRRAPRQTTASRLYEQYCASCHRPDRKGTPPEFPSLEGMSAKYKPAELESLIAKGTTRMPGYPHVARAVSALLLTGEDVPAEAPPAPTDLKYRMDGYNKFLDPDGYPAIAPPWGTLNAINLDTGEYAWKIPFGEFPDLAAKGMANTGTENYGGPVVTAGGLLFIGATNHDRKFRAYDKATGKLLWETLLPAAGNATPAVYQVNGRQYVVIACGGGKSGAPSGGSYVAFALKTSTPTRAEAGAGR